MKSFSKILDRQRSRFWELSFRQKISILSILSSLLIFLFVGGLATYHDMLNLRRAMENSSHETCKQILDTLDRMLFERYQNVKTWVSLPVMEDIQINDVDGRITGFLNQSKMSYRSYLDIFVVDLDNRFSASSNPYFLGKEAPDEIWTGHLLSGSEVYMSEVKDFRFLKKRGIALRGAIRIGPVGEKRIAGALVSIFDWSQVRRALASVRINNHELSKDRLIVLSDAKGRLLEVVGMGKEEIVKQWGKGFVRKLMSMKEGQNEISLDKKRYFVSSARSQGYSSYPGYGWRCFILRNRKLALAPIDQSIIQLIAIGTLLTLLLTLIMLRFSWNVSKPIEMVTQAMEKVYKGNYSVHLENPFRGDTGRLVSSLNYMAEGLREREKIRHTFRKYVSRDVADHLMSNMDEDLEKGKLVTATVLFSDIQGFTSISETQRPDQIVKLVNEYFERMVGIVFRYGGTLDKYIGDGMMAIWGVPQALDSAEDKACFAALDMLFQSEELNRKRREEGQPEFHVRIGINTGKVIAGSVGSSERMEFTVIGDDVNLASRLENMNKQYNTQIIISENTCKRLGKQFQTVLLGETKVRGRTVATKIYELKGLKGVGV